MVPSQPRAPTYEVCLVLRQALASLASAAAALRPLMSHLDAATLVSLDVHYRPETDTALITMRLDWTRLSHEIMDEIVRRASRAGVAVLEPARLPDEERRRYYSTYLPLYGQRATRLPSIDQALEQLARWLGVELPPAPRATDASVLEVRFRRGDGWQLGRPRSLSKDGVYVASGCPPRYGDVVGIELSCGDARLLTSGSVLHVTDAQRAENLGEAGFGAHFLLGDATERRALHEVLAAARDAIPAFTPPPRRRELRYPVRWPVVVSGDEGVLPTSALDLSMHGLFVAGEVGDSADLEVALASDEGVQPLRATARVARTVEPATARERGLQAGRGLEITTLLPGDGRRFDRLVTRVARRAGCYVVVGASAGRAAALQAELGAVGYAVAVAVDPPSLVSRAAAVTRVPDLVLLDASLDSGDLRAARAVRRALSARQVPVAITDGKTPAAVRWMTDTALLAA